MNGLPREPMVSSKLSCPLVIAAFIQIGGHRQDSGERRDEQDRFQKRCQISWRVLRVDWRALLVRSGGGDI